MCLRSGKGLSYTRCPYGCRSLSAHTSLPPVQPATGGSVHRDVCKLRVGKRKDAVVHTSLSHTRVAGHRSQLSPRSQAIKGLKALLDTTLSTRRSETRKMQGLTLLQMCRLQHMYLGSHTVSQKPGRRMVDEAHSGASERHLPAEWCILTAELVRIMMLIF